MLNLNEMIQKEVQNGLSDLNAKAKVCQDIVLKSIAEVTTGLIDFFKSL